MCRTVSVVLLFAVSAVSRAADAAETQELRRRVTELETRVMALERLLRVNEANTPAPAPAPSAPQQNPPPERTSFTMPPELVPEIGKIGAEVGLLLSGSGNPFHLDTGSFAAGFIDLPL